MTQIVLFNKPFNVLSQFTDNNDRSTLADYINIKGVYPAGRLDRDSEGLLVLTDKGALQHKIANPSNKMSKTYWVQVEGDVKESQLDLLREGINLKDGPTRPAQVNRIAEPFNLWPRTPPIRVRSNIPDCWLEITLSEGRNRQVRRMTAAIGYPTLRLIRYRIGSWTIDGIAQGHYCIHR